MITFNNVIISISGSGKKTLLDVIARRAQGPTRGQILLNGVRVSTFFSQFSRPSSFYSFTNKQVPMSMRLFQDSCAYVGRKCHLLEGLTTKQTLYYAAHLTIGMKKMKNSERIKILNLNW